MFCNQLLLILLHIYSRSARLYQQHSNEPLQHYVRTYTYQDPFIFNVRCIESGISGYHFPLLSSLLAH